MVGAWEVELVAVLERVEFVFEIVEIIPMVFQCECVKKRLPARTELTEGLETAVKSRIVESALASKNLAVPDGDESSLQYRFRFDFARGVTVDRGFVDDAHEEDCARLELGCENLVHIAAREFCKVIDCLFRDNALQLSEVQLERLQSAGRIEKYAIDGAVQVIAFACGACAVCKLSLGEHETAQLQLQVADVCLQCALGCVLGLGVQRCRDFELCLAPVFDAFFLEKFVEVVAVEAFFQAFKRRAHREAEIAVVEFQRF